MLKRLSLLVAACVLTVSCIVPTPAPVPVPTPVPPAQVGAIGVRLIPALSQVQPLIGELPATTCQLTNGEGVSFCFPVPAGEYSLDLAGLPDGFTMPQSDQLIPVTGNDTTEVIVNLNVPHPVPTLRALRVAGLRFVDGDQTWVYRGFTDFLLYQKFLAHEDLTDILNERVEVGANTVRVLGMVTSFSHFHPQEHADYYSQLRPFADYLATFGLRVEFVVFADAQVIMPVWSEETAHLDRVMTALAGATNVFCEIGNENFKNIPGGAATATALMHRVQGKYLNLLVASGNYDLENINGQYELASGDYVTTHPERKPEWPRTSKDAYDLRDGFGCPIGSIDCIPFGGFHKPVTSDEGMGADEIDTASRSAQPDDFGYYAAECALAGAGCTFHSSDGVQSARLRPIQKRSAIAFFAAEQWVPVDAQLAPYQRGDANGGDGVGGMPIEHFDAWALRTFCKQVGNEEYCVVIRPNRSWQLVPRNGWQVVGQSGPNGALIRLKR